MYTDKFDPWREADWKVHAPLVGRAVVSVHRYEVGCLATTMAEKSKNP